MAGGYTHPSPFLNWSPGQMDAAETFAESDVSISLSNTVVGSESVSLREFGSQYDPALGGGTYDETEAGFVFNPNNDIAGLQVSMHPDVADCEKVRVEDNGGTVIASEPASSGDTVQLKPSGGLSAGTKYWIYAYDSGASLDAPATDESFPVNTTDFDVVNGWRSGSTSGSVFSFETATAIKPANSGNVTVEWPTPDDLAGWDIVPFQSVEDGGTVEVYAVDASDGTELAGPLDDPGDISTLSRSTNVALRVDLSRTDTANNPRVEALYRRYKV